MILQIYRIRSGTIILPRKLADFFYATNHESPGGEIDRIFFDIDRFKGISAEQAQIAKKFL